jgi:hypothetical protein
MVLGGVDVMVVVEFDNRNKYITAVCEDSKHWLNLAIGS